MAEVSALKKHPCPECGGDAEWDASKKALACPFCGTVLPWSDGEDPMGAAIVEHDLEQELAKIPDDQLIQICIALGHPDERFPANTVVSRRKSIDDAASFIGFDSED